MLKLKLFFVALIMAILLVSWTLRINSATAAAAPTPTVAPVDKMGVQLMFIERPHTPPAAATAVEKPAFSAAATASGPLSQSRGLPPPSQRQQWPE